LQHNCFGNNLSDATGKETRKKKGKEKHTIEKEKQTATKLSLHVCTERKEKNDDIQTQ